MLYDEYTDLSSERVPCLLPAHLASSSLQVAAVATRAVEKAAPNPSTYPVYWVRQDLPKVRQCKFYLDGNSDSKIKIIKSILSSSFFEDE